MARRTAGLTAERGAEMARQHVATAWRDHGPASTGADLAAALENDRAEHWEGDASGPAPDYLALACGQVAAARIMGYPTLPPASVAAALERQWTVRQRTRGARGRITAPEILRRARIAAGHVGGLSTDERAALTGELVRMVGRRNGWTPESRTVSIGRLAQWGHELAARSREQVARRADADTGRDAWRDTADRAALYLDAPAGADDDAGETVGQVAAMSALRSDPWTAGRIRRDAATYSSLADALGLDGLARDTFRAALAGWDAATYAADAGTGLEAGRKRLQRGGRDIREQYPEPADLAAALLAAEASVVADAGADLDTERDYLADGPDLPAAARMAETACDRAAAAARNVNGATPYRDRGAALGRGLRRMRSRHLARQVWGHGPAADLLGSGPAAYPVRQVWGMSSPAE